MKKKFIPIILFLGYVIILLQVLVFKELALIRIGQLKFNFGGTQEGPANLIPFKTILYYVQGHNGLLIACINILGNIIALVPLGFLVPFVFTKTQWKHIIILAVVSGLTIEIIQLLLHIGIFDIDDVLLNGLGVVIGFWKFNIYSNFSKTTKATTSTIIFMILGGIISLYVLSYFKLVQLPIGIEPSVQREKLAPLNSMQAGNKECCDLCNGTGGTGQIVSIGNNTINIVRRDGKNELIKITKATTIKANAGPANNKDLKIGDHVTVVIDETETASLILVCGLK
jgi:glycopeptide antibiotics resistance protein